VLAEAPRRDARTECAEAATPVNNETRVPVRGIALDCAMRCAHYRTPLDIVAIKMKCCATWYACKDCHDALAGHAIETWPHGEWGQLAVLCGACGMMMSIRNYLTGANACPACMAAFNPGCRNHHHFYFAIPRDV
jgi:uncharacterized CHY-type Zn-finger protein